MYTCVYIYIYNMYYHVCAQADVASADVALGLCEVLSKRIERRTKYLAQHGTKPQGSATAILANLWCSHAWCGHVYRRPGTHDCSLDIVGRTANLLR